MGTVSGAEEADALYPGPSFEPRWIEPLACSPGIRRMDVEVCYYFHYNEITMKEEKMNAARGKPEYVTNLYGNRMVSKTHGRILFRGVIDSLEADFIEAQVLASGMGEGEYCACLGEILDLLRAIMSAEVKAEPLPPPVLFGMEAETIHRLSQSAGGCFGKVLPLPAYTQGPLAARLNTLRAKVREAELLAVRIFGPDENSSGPEPGEAEGTGDAQAFSAAYDSSDLFPRDDIILALNRLSSALWWLFCKYLSERSLRTEPPA